MNSAHQEWADLTRRHQPRTLIGFRAGAMSAQSEPAVA